MKVMVRIGGFLIMAFLGLACQPMERDYSAYPKLDPSALPAAAEPPPGPLQDAMRNLEGGQAREVVKQLGPLQPVSPLEKAWHRLLLGQAYFTLGITEKGHRLLLANYEELRDARPAPDDGRSRVLARSLKKLGGYYRDQADYERAYVLHQLQWLYMKRMGSLLEKHEALINLDIDAALLRNYFASEQWLREALQTAQQMPQGLDRQRSMIITWNNLALSLTELLRFQEAEAAAQESRRISQVYDPASGAKEFREVWALAQMAEVLEAWGQFMQTKTPAESRPLHERAQARAMEALALAEKQGMSDNNRAKLEQQMRRICGVHCRS